MTYKNIPLELQSLKSWVVWRYEDIGSAKPTKIPYCAHTNKLASVANPETWSTFEQVVTVANSGLYSGIGFVLSDANPYCFIDIDPTEKSEFWDKQTKVVDHFDSYTEYSPSGKGLHIIVRGSVPSGRKRNAIEIYSDLRYMTMTGDVYKNEPIRSYDSECMALWGSMEHSSKKVQLYQGMEKPEYRDDEILKMATEAVNGEKFVNLWEGGWAEYYQSQSEGDLALVDILAFYSKNKKQISRLFLQSELGQRDKAKRVGYIGYMTNKCFDNMLPPIDMEGLQNRLNEIIEKKKKIEIEESKKIIYHTETVRETEQTVDVKSSNDIYSLPPGLLGEIAQFIYKRAYLPVSEIALAGAIGCMSGICGRSYNINGAGLNQYVLLLAETGVGKDAMDIGISELFNSVRNTVPAAADFLGPAQLASPQGVVKYMSGGKNSFVTIMGEFGIDMQMMCHRNAPPALVGIKKFLLQIYSKSGKGGVLRPTVYSDKEKNTNTLYSPSFSLLAEGTQSSFYKSLDEGLIADGLLPRFTVIEYGGPRVEENESASLVKPSYELIEKFGNICAYSLSLNNENKTIDIEMDGDALDIFRQLKKECRLRINSTTEEVTRQMWNRVNLKSMKLAALVAVGVNPLNPVITPEHANWAINIITNDARNFISKFDNGEVGLDSDENDQLKKVIDVIKQYVMSPYSDVSKYSKGMSNLHSDKIVPYAFIQRKLASIAVFRKDRLGSSMALKRAISTLIERGDICEMSKIVMSKEYDTTARSFMIKNFKGFDL